MANYAIIENNLVVNTAVAESAYATSMGWIPCVGSVSIGYSYIDGQFIEPILDSEVIKEQNKTQATVLLQQTDWTQVADVPLINKQAFVEYRAAIRSIVLNPEVDSVFPPIPAEQWT